MNSNDKMELRSVQQEATSVKMNLGEVKKL